MWRQGQQAYLIELQAVQKLVQLAVLLLLIQHDVVLDQAVQRELGFIVHVDLHRLQQNKAPYLFMALTFPDRSACLMPLSMAWAVQDTAHARADCMHAVHAGMLQ